MSEDFIVKAISNPCYHNQEKKTARGVSVGIDSPAGQLKKLLIGFIKSLIFAGEYCALVRRCVCLGTTYYKYSEVKAFPIGVLASITLVLQPISRQSQIALYTLNKSTEVLYNMALRRNMVPKVALGECWLTSIAFAIICFVYLNEPQTWRINYRRGMCEVIICLFSNFMYNLYQIKPMKALNKFMSEDFIARAISNPLQNETCAQLHAGSCNLKALSQFCQGCRSMYKIYLLIHLIPLLLFKRKKLCQDPLGQLRRTWVGFVKSLLFAGGFSMLGRRGLCIGTTYFKYSQRIGFPAATFASISLVMEPISRQSQIALYSLNKTMEVIYNMALRRNMVTKKLPLGQCWLTSIAFAIICFVYINEPQTWRTNYRRILDKLLGDV